MKAIFVFLFFALVAESFANTLYNKGNYHDNSYDYKDSYPKQTYSRSYHEPAYKGSYQSKLPYCRNSFKYLPAVYKCYSDKDCSKGYSCCLHSCGSICEKDAYYYKRTDYNYKDEYEHKQTYYTPNTYSNSYNEPSYKQSSYKESYPVSYKKHYTNRYKLIKVEPEYSNYGSGSHYNRKYELIEYVEEPTYYNAPAHYNKYDNNYYGQDEYNHNSYQKPKYKHIPKYKESYSNNHYGSNYGYSNYDRY